MTARWCRVAPFGLVAGTKTWRCLAIFGIVFGLASAAGEGAELNTLMREKLLYTQKILEAIVTSNWTALEAQSRALEKVTDDRRWTVLKYSEYSRHSATFVQAVQTLRTAAARRDLDDTLKAYADVTQECVQCHQYLARQRIAN